MNLKSLEPLQRRIGHFPIELPAAALMALAVALVTVALPTWRFESLVAASGLPGIIGAAQPPLGQTARIVTALGLGVLSFLGVFYGLRALDRRPAETDFPAFRTADLHPDAPRRRPILAGAEFGAPADNLPPIEQQLRRRKIVPSEPLPSFLAPQPSDIGDFVPETRPAPGPSAHSEQPLDPAPSFLQPTPQTLPEAIEDDFMQDPGPQDPPFEEIVPSNGRAAVRSPAVGRAEEVAPDAPPAPWAPAVTAPQPENDDDAEESVSDLMARLETGLSGRGSRPQPTGSTPFAQEELARALSDLDRVAGRSDRS